MAKYNKLSETERHLRNLLGMDGKAKDSIYLEMGNQTEQKPQMKIFCVDLTPLSRMAQFLILCAATFFFYLIYGYLQVSVDNHFRFIVRYVSIKLPYK